MGSVNISITKDVYDFLTEQKKGSNRSYSQIIRSLKQKAGYEKGSLRELQKVYGSCKDIDVKEFSTNAAQFRDEFEKRLLK
jgi:predicted CopG family antitoxin